MSWVWRGLLAGAVAGVVAVVAWVLAGPEPPARGDARAGPCDRLQDRGRACAAALRGEARRLADRLARSDDADHRRLARHLGPLLDGALGGEAIREQCARLTADPDAQGLVREVARCYQAAGCPAFARCLRDVAEDLLH